jgi:hypothetical protein
MPSLSNFGDKSGGSGACASEAYCLGAGVWAILDAFAHNMTVLLHFFPHVSRHGNIDRAIGMIPIKAKPAIKIARPVFSEGICLYY